MDRGKMRDEAKKKGNVTRNKKEGLQNKPWTKTVLVDWRNGKKKGMNRGGVVRRETSSNEIHVL